MSGPLWKERFGFVSGNILAWGLLLLSLWPKVATADFGLTVRPWTTNPPAAALNAELWSFWFLSMVLILAISITSLAVGYILLRGLWFGFAGGSLDEPAQGSWDSRIDKLCELTYLGILALVALAIIAMLQSLILALLRGAMYLLVSRLLKLETPTVGWIAYGIVVFLVSVPMGVFLYKIVYAKSRLVRMSGPLALRLTGMLVGITAVWMLSYLVTVEFCRNVDLTLEQSIVDQVEDDVLTGTLILGGSASRLADASISHARPNGAKEPLSCYKVSPGHYVFSIPLSELQPGLHQIQVSYPHIQFSQTFPFVANRIRIVRGFVVNSW